MTSGPTYLFPFVCLECQKAFKRPLESNHRRPCPICGNPAIQVSRKFKAPKADDHEQWQKVRLLVEHGFLFQSIYDDQNGGLVVPYPTTLKDAREWIKKWEHKSIESLGT